MVTLRYGRGELALPHALGGCPWLVGSEPPPLPDPAAAIDGALLRPMGIQGLASFVEPGDRVTLVEDDELPRELRDLVVSRILEVLGRAGVGAISRVEAPGRTFLPSPGPVGARGGTVPTGAAQLLAPAPSERVPPSSDHLRPPAPETDFEPLGWSRELGIVRVRREIARADKLILLGAGSFDPLAGFGGGPQLVARGCADPATANALLRLALHPFAPSPRSPNDSPLQAAIASVLEIAPPAFLIQLELQRGQRLAGVFAGDPLRAFATSTVFHRKWHEVTLPAPLEGIVASAGGAPHDRSLSAALPALAAACLALRPGGAAIVLASCPEGAGHLDRVDADADEGPSLLASLLRRLTAGIHCTLVTRGLEGTDAGALGLHLAPSLEAALEISPVARADPALVGILEGTTLLPRPG